MGKVHVETLVSQVLEQLQVTGVPYKRLKDYRYCGFGEIVKYFQAQGNPVYSAKMLDAFMGYIRGLYEKEAISRWKWQQISNSAAWLEEFYTFGMVTMEPLAKWEVLHNPFHQIPSKTELQDNDNLFGLVYRTKQELLKFNLSKKSIRNYTYDGFDAILRYCTKCGIITYSKVSLENFVAEARLAYEKQQMCRSVYQNVRKTAALLEEYHDTGKLVWHYLPAQNTKPLSLIFSRAVDDYCETNCLHWTLADGTIATNKSAIRQFLFCVEDMGIYDFSAMTRQIVNNSITMLAPRYPRGMNSCIPAIRSFLTFLFEKGITTEALQTAIPETSAPRRAIRHGFSSDELEQLLAAADRTTIVGKRDYAMMMLAIQTGLRVIDISELTFQNINWHTSEIHIIQHKTGKALSVPMEPEIGNALVDYILNGRPECEESFVFLSKDQPYRKLHNRSASSIVYRYLQKCRIDREKIPRRGFHSFRRSFGARLLQSEVPLEILSELLGHSNIDSSKPYVAVDDVGLRSCAIGLSGIDGKAGDLLW